MKKIKIAKELNISRPTLNKYLKKGFPNDNMYNKYIELVLSDLYDKRRNLVDELCEINRKINQLTK